MRQPTTRGQASTCAGGIASGRFRSRSTTTPAKSRRAPGCVPPSDWVPSTSTRSTRFPVRIPRALDSKPNSHSRATLPSSAPYSSDSLASRSHVRRFAARWPPSASTAKGARILLGELRSVSGSIQVIGPVDQAPWLPVGYPGRLEPPALHEIRTSDSAPGSARIVSREECRCTTW